MRKWIIAAMIGFLAGTSWAAGLKMIYPNNGESLNLGATVNITWDPGGVPGKVTLILYQNKAKLGHIASNIQNTGSVSWVVGKTDGQAAAAGSGYVIRVKSFTSNVQDASDKPFTIVTPGSTFKPWPVSLVSEVKFGKTIGFHKPLNATVKLQSYFFGMAGPGKLFFLEASLLLKSEADWQIGGFGHPDYGSQWVMCRIENPVWVEGVGVQGKTIFYGTFSVHGGADSAKLETYPTQIFPKGTATYGLRFKPQVAGQLAGIRTIQKMPQQPFGPGSLCIRNYYPKITLYAVVWTDRTGSTGINVSDSLTFYLQYPPKPDWVPLISVNLPGETNLCASGFQKW
jgi:hypothetical protein